MDLHVRKILLGAFILGGMAVLLGAFGAHGLRDKLSAVRLESYKTGVLYHFFHVFALVITAWLIHQLGASRSFLRAAQSFLLGIACFSGSLYGIAFLTAIGSLGEGESIGFWGLVTPLGGVFFMIGWALLAMGIAKKG